MPNFKKRIIVSCLSLVLLVSLSSSFVFAQTTPTTTPAPTGSTSSLNKDALNKRIAELETKVAETRAQKNSLSSQIDAMDSQIQLTEYRINATQQEITDLSMDIDTAGKKMESLEGSLSDVSKVLINRIVATYQAGGNVQMQALLTSDDISDFFSRANYLRIVQSHDKQVLYSAQQARNDYANQKIIFETKKKKIETLKVQLEGYTAQLDKDKDEKGKLLVLTKNDESRYQSLLNEARRQVGAFKSFATSQGGSILPPQSSPDGWYYNQRDSRWGNINMGSSPESTWEVGCLATSMAMIMKKHGENVTPADVVSNSSYFFSNTAYMSIPWGSGKFSSRFGNNQAVIDSKLASGEPVIVGVKNNSHFIVLKSGSGGNYTMNDPWNGPDLNFSDYYSSISQYGWYN